MCSRSAAIAESQQSLAVPTISEQSSSQAAVATTKEEGKRPIHTICGGLRTAHAAEENWFASELTKYPPKGQCVLANVSCTCDISWPDQLAWVQLRFGCSYACNVDSHVEGCTSGQCAHTAVRSVMHLRPISLERAQTEPYVALLRAASCNEPSDTLDLSSMPTSSGTELDVT